MCLYSANFNMLRSSVHHSNSPNEVGNLGFGQPNQPPDPVWDFSMCIPPLEQGLLLSQLSHSNCTWHFLTCVGQISSNTLDQFETKVRGMTLYLWATTPQKHLVTHVNNDNTPHFQAFVGPPFYSRRSSGPFPYTGVYVHLLSASLQAEHHLFFRFWLSCQ